VLFDTNIPIEAYWKSASNFSFSFNSVFSVVSKGKPIENLIVS
jgi:hypothetical protein